MIVDLPPNSRDVPRVNPPSLEPIWQDIYGYSRKFSRTNNLVICVRGFYSFNFVHYKSG